MTRKILIVFLSVIATVFAQAQTSLNVTTSKSSSPKLLVENTENFVKIGYCDEEIEAVIGLNSTALVRVYTQFSEESLANVVGENLTKVNIGIGYTNTKTATLNLSYTLNGTPFYTQDFSVTAEEWNEVVLNDPYVIEGKEFYIGYSIRPSSNGEGPISLDKGPYVENSSWLYISNQWGNLWELGVDANVNIIGIVEGENILQNEIELKAATVPYSIVTPNEEFEVSTTVVNNGAKTVKSFDITYKIGENETVTETVTGVDILNYGKYEYSRNIKTSQNGKLPVEVVISNPNGVDDEIDSNNLLTRYVLVGELNDTPTFVSVDESNKNVILEEYTGVHCQFCPLGHKKADEIKEENPGRVVAINIHAAGFADRYRTAIGEELFMQAIGSATSYSNPAASVNRRLFSGQINLLNSDRDGWARQVNQILAESSCVNLAVRSELDYDNSTLVVHVEGYYTADSEVEKNRLNVAILQDSVMGYQSNGARYYPAMYHDGLYQHNHMLRDLITGQWGEVIEETTEGSFFARKYIYQFPEYIRDVKVNLEKMQVVAFIAESQTDILTGAQSEMEYIGEPPVSSIDIAKTGNLLVNYSVSNGVIYANLEANGNVTAELYNLEGKKIASTVTYVEGTSGISIPVNGTRGIYILKVNSDQKNETIKIVY